MSGHTVDMAASLNLECTTCSMGGFHGWQVGSARKWQNWTAEVSRRRWSGSHFYAKSKLRTLSIHHHHLAAPISYSDRCGQPDAMNEGERAIATVLTVFNHEPHSGFGGSEFPAPFRTQKDQRYFSNDWNRFQKVLAPFRTQNRRKHFNCLTISYVCLNLSLPFVTAPITIHYKLHSGPSGGLIQVYLRPWYIYIYPTYRHLSRLRPSKTVAEVSFTFYLVFTSI